MTDDDDVFDPQGGSAARDEGIDRADRHADPVWKAWWEDAVRRIAEQQQYFSTDDVERLKLMEQVTHTTHEKRAIGGIMRRANKDGVCAPTENWVQSQRRVNHRRPLRVWASLLYQTR